ncbi:MAG: hypothetical protein GX228_04420 [Firmicutes bacterium]|jgi:ATP-binding cassette subfamily B protein|nr:hypothetical protein [Bacillota bacterium]NLL88167.1 hypothetical protein [Bacillota bacterium]HKM17443.1 hypothetical protein [Limnochordia bacterium]
MLALVKMIPELITYAFVVAKVAPYLLMLVIIAMIPAFIDSMAMGIKGWEFIKQINRERRLSGYYALLITNRHFAPEIRLYELADYCLGQWEALFTKTSKQQRRFSLKVLLRQRAAVIFMVCVSMVGLWGIVFAGMVQATPGDYVVLLQSIIGLLTGLSVSSILKGMRSSLFKDSKTGAW